VILFDGLNYCSGSTARPRASRPGQRGRGLPGPGRFRLPGDQLRRTHDHRRRDVRPADLVVYNGGVFALYFDGSASGAGIATSDNVSSADESSARPVLAMDVPSDLLPTTGPATYLPASSRTGTASTTTCSTSWRLAHEQRGRRPVLPGNPGRVYDLFVYQNRSGSPNRRRSSGRSRSPGGRAARPARRTTASTRARSGPGTATSRSCAATRASTSPRPSRRRPPTATTWWCRTTTPRRGLRTGLRCLARAHPDRAAPAGTAADRCVVTQILTLVRERLTSRMKSARPEPRSGRPRSFLATTPCRPGGTRYFLGWVQEIKHMNTARRRWPVRLVLLVSTLAVAACSRPARPATECPSRSPAIRGLPWRRSIASR